MKQCTIYGCSAVAPRNSKVCIEHLRLGVLEIGPEPKAPITLEFDRGASSFFFVNHTGHSVSAVVTMFDGQISDICVAGGKLSDNDVKKIHDHFREQKEKGLL